MSTSCIRKLLALAFLLGPAPLAFSQGVLVPPQVAFKTVNGFTTPIANATITVCGALTGGIPCSPVLVNAVFRDAALTQPLSNPFTSDSSGNYQFAIAAGNYTVTVTASGFSGYSYQITAASGSGGASNISGLASGQVPIANSPTSLSSSKPLQGADTNIMTAGIVGGAGSSLCPSPLGGATTINCLIPYTLGSQGPSFETVPCASLNGQTTTDAGCTAVFNDFILNSAGVTTNNRRHTLNVYYEGDMHQTGSNEYYALDAVSSILVDAGTNWANSRVIAFEPQAVISDLASSGVVLPNVNTIKARSIMNANTHATNLIPILLYLPTFNAGSVTTNYFGFGADAPTGTGTVTNFATVVASENLNNISGTNTVGLDSQMTASTFTNVYGGDFAGANGAILGIDTTAASSFIGHASGTLTGGFTLHDGWYSGTGSPAGVVTAAIGSFFSRRDGGAGTALYIKESGGGASSGWNTFLTSANPGSLSSFACGITGTTSCVITGSGSTSGTATITWPAVAGTVTNSIVFSNALALPAGAAGTPSLNNAGSGGLFWPATSTPSISSSGAEVIRLLSTGPTVAALTYGMTSAFGSTNDAGMSRSAAAVIAFGNGTAADTTAKLKAAALISVGTKFTSNAGCSETALVGGAAAGQFASGTTGTCTVVITMGNSATAPNGWDCAVNDHTTANLMRTTASTTTTATVSGTTVTADVISFSCVGY